MAVVASEVVVDWTKLSTREMIERMDAMKREDAARGLPAPGTAEALLYHMDHGPKAVFEPGEFERLLEEVYRLRHEEV